MSSYSDYGGLLLYGSSFTKYVKVSPFQILQYRNIFDIEGATHMLSYRVAHYHTIHGDSGQVSLKSD